MSNFGDIQTETNTQKVFFDKCKHSFVIFLIQLLCVTLRFVNPVLYSLFCLYPLNLTLGLRKALTLHPEIWFTGSAALNGTTLTLQFAALEVCDKSTSSQTVKLENIVFNTKAKAQPDADNLSRKTCPYTFPPSLAQIFDINVRRYSQFFFYLKNNFCIHILKHKIRSTRGNSGRGQPFYIRCPQYVTEPW